MEGIQNNSKENPNHKKAPTLKTRWSGVLSASSYGPMCIQQLIGLPEPVPSMSEDCL